MTTPKPVPQAPGSFADILAALNPDEIEVLSAHLGGGWAKQMFLAEREPVSTALDRQGYDALFHEVGSVLDDLHAAWLITWPRRRQRRAGAA